MAEENLVYLQPGFANVSCYLSGLEIAKPERQAWIVVRLNAKRFYIGKVHDFPAQRMAKARDRSL